MSKLLLRLALAAAIVAFCLPAQQTKAEALSHVSAHPEIQMWTYPVAGANGAGSVRNRGATFAAYLAEDEGTGETYFYPGSGPDPSRRASILIATDTTVSIPAGLSPDQYQIDSLRVTMTLLGSLIYEPLGYTLPYDNTLDSPTALADGSDDGGHPIEMYGVGLQGDYQAISFDSSPDDTALQLGDVRWRPYQEGEEGYDPELPDADQAVAPYQYFAVDTQGRDAENSVAGGYSATEGSSETLPFAPDPFAIGKLYDGQGVELTPGTLMNSGDEFVFEPDLTNPGVVQYLQGSLASGSLGFMFSSMHQPDGQFGAVPYPDFYLDDLDVGYNQDGAAPVIELGVTIVDSLPGDYDGDGAVDASDYALWREQYGGAGPQADGNADGVVDAADYTVWRDNLPAPLAAAASTVPEPSSVAILGLFGVTIAFCGWAEWVARPRRNREG